MKLQFCCRDNALHYSLDECALRTTIVGGLTMILASFRSPPFISNILIFLTSLPSLAAI